MCVDLVMWIVYVCCPVDGSGSAVDAAYEMARRLSEAGVRRMSGISPFVRSVLTANNKS